MKMIIKKILRNNNKNIIKNYLSSSSSLIIIDKGDIATIHIKGIILDLKYNEPNVFVNTKENNEPVKVRVGIGSSIPGIDRVLLGLKEKDKIETIFEPIEAFGFHNPKKVLKIDRSKFQDAITGKRAKTSYGVGVITSVNEKEVIIDHNHPFCDKRIGVDIEIVSIEKVKNIENLYTEIIAPGDGKTYPKSGDTVTVHYTGTFATSGQEFDSSVTRNQPFSFVVGAGLVIPGWDNGITKISLGEKAKLFIPYALGYGDQEVGPIPPCTDLIFDIELLSINGTTIKS